MVARALAASAAVLLATSCGARTDLPCFDEPCPRPEDEELSHATACEVELSEPPPCTGSGLIDTIEDRCIDDGGGTDSGDVLEIYCEAGIARFCLSHESCPWRASEPTGPDAPEPTCSRGGLDGAFMARTIHGCEGWQGRDLFCCSDSGRIGVATR